MIDYKKRALRVLTDEPDKAREQAYRSLLQSAFESADEAVLAARLGCSCQISSYCELCRIVEELIENVWMRVLENRATGH